MDTIIVVGLILAAVGMLFYRSDKIAREAVAATQEEATEPKDYYDEKLKEIVSEVVFVTTEEIPGKSITRCLGGVRAISSRITSEGALIIEEKVTLRAFLENAKAMGANAVVGMKVQSISFEQNGSKWNSGNLYYTGTAVVVE
ncbi:MAG: hypothetical protein CMN80_14495 [Spongiibacter sp.]|uniref:heavy metal-binding domain-containing protein n=1 Tax=Spongiibacter sp. TaxID=2024860 RepID=UPI000C098B6D|nr:heavy metal-binding domain-containing protein [Spongiibacter sp.]MAK45346.1 hypothetical protein [Spongiibacter sp.]